MADEQNIKPEFQNVSTGEEITVEEVVRQLNETAKPGEGFMVKNGKVWGAFANGHGYI